MATRGFTGRPRPPGTGNRVPPGQSVTSDFPVLSATPTQHVPLDQWTWEEFNSLPQTAMTRDIHCVTKWSKFDTAWRGVLIDDILDDADLAPPTQFTLAHSFGGYTTNVPVADLLGGKAMVALQYDGHPITPDHGGPARLLVPHLYFWKSAKWVSGLQFTQKDEAGFWELRGYHLYGDPWREQRFDGD